MKNHLLIILCGSIIYSVLVPIHPVYIISIIMLFIALPNPNFKIGGDSLFIIYIYIGYYTFLFTYFQTGISEFINIVLGLFSFYLIYNYRFKLDRDALSFILLAFLSFGLLYFGADAFVRFKYPSSADSVFLQEEGWYYIYKTNSIIAQDSNSVGLIILSVISLLIVTIYSSLISKKKIAFFLFSYCALLILTLSKSAIISLLILLLCGYWFCFVKKRSRVIFLSLILFSFLFYIFMMIYGNDISLDASFKTKKAIYFQTLQFILNERLDKVIIGVGLHNSVDYLGGRYSHALLSNIILEAGLAGIFVNLILGLWLIRITRGIAVFSYIPLFISGLSYSSGHGFIYFYVIMAVSYVVYSSNSCLVAKTGIYGGARKPDSSLSLLLNR